MMILTYIILIVSGLYCGFTISYKFRKGDWYQKSLPLFVICLLIFVMSAVAIGKGMNLNELEAWIVGQFTNK